MGRSWEKSVASATQVQPSSESIRKTATHGDPALMRHEWKYYCQHLNDAGKQTGILNRLPVSLLRYDASNAAFGSDPSPAINPNQVRIIHTRSGPIPSHSVTQELLNGIQCLLRYTKAHAIMPCLVRPEVISCFCESPLGWLKNHFRQFYLLPQCSSSDWPCHPPIATHFCPPPAPIRPAELAASSTSAMFSAPTRPWRSSSCWPRLAQRNRVTKKRCVEMAVDARQSGLFRQTAAAISSVFCATHTHDEVQKIFYSQNSKRAGLLYPRNGSLIMVLIQKGCKDGANALVTVRPYLNRGRSFSGAIDGKENGHRRSRTSPLVWHVCGCGRVDKYGADESTSTRVQGGAYITQQAGHSTVRTDECPGPQKCVRP